MADFADRSTVDILKHFHEQLDVHFRALNQERERLDPPGPTFALEHGLSAAEFELLKASVRAAVAAGFGAVYRTWWLPYVVYAADVGYDYIGKDYWPRFAERTPGWEAPNSGWDVGGQRARLRSWFVKFANEYGGARPTGAFAQFFINIAWPIMHAVLPIYLQRQLAQLLDEYAIYLTNDLLNDPDALGRELARQAYLRDYPERFQKFCSQQALLGRIATALLAGDEEESPYLLPDTLKRIVDGLMGEQKARLALQRARRSASRARAAGFRPTSTGDGSRSGRNRAPNLSDPRLRLKRMEEGWRLFADIPDLAPLAARLPELVDALRIRRAQVAGVDRPVMAGRLLRPGEQLLGALPTPGTPFVTLLGASAAANTLLSLQCRLSPGPWWVFKRRSGAHAIEVKGKHVTPGERYLLLGYPDAIAPDVPWLRELEVRVSGARAFELDVPEQVSEAETAVLTSAGISVVAGVRVRPVGLVPLGWDGEGSVEYLAVDPVLLSIRSERTPESCVLTVNDGPPQLLQWPSGETEFFFAVDDLAVGVHSLTVTLLGSGAGTVATGTLMVSIRQPNTEGTGAGEGIRLLASPARPLLTDLWDGRATLTIDGPPDTDAQLVVTLKDERDRELAHVRRTVTLPLSEEGWRRIARQDLRSSDLGDAYDEAETCEVVVSRSGIGFASLACERGFRPLRWVISKRHDGPYEARLIDRTDGSNTVVDLFESTAPLEAIRQANGTLVESPLVGGLLRAQSGEQSASVVLPPDHMELIRRRNAARPYVRVGSKSAVEAMRFIRGHAAWMGADLPANPFADRQREKALAAITSELAGLIAGNRWAHQERVQRDADILDHLEKMQALAGDMEDQELAKRVNDRLWRWAQQPGLRTPELAELLGSLIASSGMGDAQEATRFLVCLTTAPGRLLKWDEGNRNRLLECVLRSPVLVRVVRMAVLGSDALRLDAQDTRQDKGA